MEAGFGATADQADTIESVYEILRGQVGKKRRAKTSG